MARPNGIVALLTDFGLRDPYAGAMKGALLSVYPRTRIVDISHEVEPQDVAAASFLLRHSYPYFPKGTLFVVVVDPGVGTERAAIALETRDHLFLAPDNGILSFLVEKRRLVRIANEKFFRHPVSKTFHGRDVFAPVAGHLLRGRSLNELGETIRSLVQLPTPTVRKTPGGIVGEVVAIDRFGNLVTNIALDRLSATRALEVRVGQARIRGLSATYAARKADELLAYVGSGGALEIAVHRGSAAARLRAKIGSSVTCSSS